LTATYLSNLFHSSILGKAEMAPSILIDLIEHYPIYFEGGPGEEGKRTKLRVGRSMSNSLLSKIQPLVPKKKKEEDHMVTGPFNVTKASREEILQLMEREKEKTKGGTL